MDVVSIERRWGSELVITGDETEGGKQKVYMIRGDLFFASVRNFLELFDPVRRGEVERTGGGGAGGRGGELCHAVVVLMLTLLLLLLLVLLLLSCLCCCCCCLLLLES